MIARGRRLLRGSVGTISIRLLDLPSRYGFHLLVAARLGVVEAGAFYVCYSVLTLVTGFGRIGIDRAITRSVAQSMALGKVDAARHAIRRGLRLVIRCSILVTVLVVAAAWPLCNYVLHQPELALPLALGAIAILPQNVGQIMAGGLAGLQRVGLSQMIYSWLMPSIFCVLVLLMPIDVTRALLLVAVSLTISTAIGIVLLRRHMPAAQGQPAVSEPLIDTGLSLFSSELIPLLISSAPAFVLGMSADTAEVGIYALAWRVTLIINLLTTAIGAMAAPRFADGYARGDTEAVQRTARHALALNMLLAAGPIVVLMLFAGPLLHMFGNGYEHGATTVRLLLLGQAINVCCTALPELLGMTGYAATLRRINAWSVVALVAGLAILVPIWGAEGAALATCLTFLVNGVFATVTAHRHIGFVPLGAFYRGARDRLFGRSASAAS